MQIQAPRFILSYTTYHIPQSKLNPYVSHSHKQVVGVHPLGIRFHNVMDDFMREEPLLGGCSRALIAWNSAGYTR